jgi:hypothetical protein
MALVPRSVLDELSAAIVDDAEKEELTYICTFD